jgi:muramoyltetrapeptide carboxypeptidase
MLDCVQPSGQSYTLQQVVTRVLQDCDVPIAYGLRSGHVDHGNVTLPFGVQAQLEVQGGNAELQILESAVSSRAV